MGEVEKIPSAEDLMKGYIKPEKLVVDLKRFVPDPFYCNTLLRVYPSFSTNHLYDMIQWDEKGIKVWRQEEGCFHCHQLSGPYELSWNQIQKLSEAKEDVNLAELVIPKECLDKLLKLREMKYEKEEDAEAINKLLKE